MKTSLLSCARVVSSLLAVCLSADLTAGPVTPVDSKNPKAVTIEDTWSLPGILGGGVKTTDEYTEGNVFLVLPVYSTIGRDGFLSGDVLFVEPYSSWGEQGEVAASLGLGWRHLFTTQSVTAITRHDGHQAGFFEEGVFIGANVFVDMLDTQFDNQFWQLGVGVEVGTRYLEARANYYIPLSDRELAFERRTTQTFANSSTSTSQRITPINNPYATGNTIAQDATFTTLATTTTTTTTIEQLFRLYEEGMEGWDVEVGFLVPGVDRYMDVKLIGGYYSFDNQPFGPQTGGTGNVEGWKAGVEVRPVPAVALTATWYEDERFVGSDWLYGIRLEIPFEMGDLGDGKGFWGRAGDAFRPRRRHLAERLVEPVRRQNEAVQIGNDTETETDVSTSTKRVTRVVSQSARHIILVDDVVFVNNDGPTGNGIQTGSDVTGTGIAELPFATIQTGANLAQANSNATSRVWNVYTQGTVAGYAESVVATTGSVNFIGSGRLIPGLAGTSFGTGPAPAVTGGFRGAGIGFFGITAYNITGGLGSGDADGIRLLNVPQFIIDGNTIANVGSDAIDVRSNGGVVSTGLITQNTISDSGDMALELDSRDGSTLNINLINNSFTGGTGNDQVDATARHGSTFNLVATGNTFTDTTEDALNIFVIDGATFNLTATGNLFTNIDSDAILVEMEDGSGGTMLIAGNIINTTGDQGIDFFLIDGASLTATVTGNTIVNADDDAVEIELFDGAVFTFNMFGNTIITPGSDGVEVSLFNGGNLTANINGNTIMNADGDGFDLDAFDASTMTIGIHQNTITGADEVGILAEASGSSVVNFTASGNTITGNNVGIELLSNLSGNGATSNFTVSQNTITGNTENGLVATSIDSGIVASSNFTIVGNTLTNNGQNGAVLTSSPTGPVASSNFTIVGNTLANNGQNGAVLTGSPADIGTTSNFTFANNTVTGHFAGNGVTANSTGPGGGSVTTFNFSGNVINTNIAGIFVTTAMTGPAVISNVNINGNTITGNIGAAVFILSNDTGAGATGNFTLTGNTLSNNSNGGLFAQFIGITTDANLTLSGNIILNNGSVGLDLGTVGTANVDITLSGNTVGFSLLDQIRAFEAPGSTLNFLNIGTLNNSVLEAPGDPDFLYNSISGGEGGFIFINGNPAHPANTDLP